jgi:hypothetical protein
VTAACLPTAREERVAVVAECGGEKRKGKDLVFCTRTGREFDAHKFSGTFAGFSPRQGDAEERTPPSLRHTFVSLLSYSGVRRVWESVARTPGA